MCAEIMIPVKGNERRIRNLSSDGMCVPDVLENGTHRPVSVSITDFPPDVE